MTTTGEHSGTKYVIALGVLIVLTALSFGLHYAPLGGVFGAIVAFSIAAVKVTVVGLVFMELYGAHAATRVVALVTVSFVLLLCLGVVADIALR